MHILNKKTKDREAVINAFIHNDWKNETPPTIFIYDDRIEILSYGELPYKLSKEKFFNGQSVPINRGLFTVFMVNQIAEQSGHGVPTIVAKYGKESFDFSSGAILVTIKFAFSFRHIEINESFVFDEHITTQENSKTTQGTTQENSKTTQETTQENSKTTQEIIQENGKTTQETTKVQILEIISNNGNVTLNEIAEKLKLSRDGVKYHITELQKEGKIRHEGATKAGQWVIIK